jgi:CrcB protein
MGISEIVWVGIGSAAGGIFRFLITQSTRSIAPLFTFPISTLIVNFLGCVGIGFLFHSLKGRDPWSFVFIVGFLGSFTTFSAFSFETVQLLRSGEIKTALFNIFLQLFFCLIGTWMGHWIYSKFLSA